MRNRPQPAPEAIASSDVSTAPRLVVTDPGPRLAAALAEMIADAKAGDPLSPVDVVVPTAVAGVTLRRAVAGDCGLANVRFGSLPQLAERLAARRLALGGPSLRLPVTSSARRRALRAALATSTGTLASAARHRETAALLEQLMAELDGASLVPAPTGLSHRGREVVALHDAYRGQLGGAVLEPELLEHAVHGLPETSVVLVLTGRLTDAEQTFLARAHGAGRLRAVVASTAPEHERQLLVRLLDGVDASPDEPQDVHLLVAPDAEEEVRLAVRSALAHLAEHGCRPERIGIAYGSSIPYVRLLREQLRAAEIPHHVPRQRTLAQTVAGRTVLGLLDAVDRGLPRADVLDWLSDGPLLDRASHPLPIARWDRLSREAGVARGLDGWRDRLSRAAAKAESSAERGDEESAERFTSRAATCRELLAQVEDAAAAADAVLSAPSWPAVADAVTALLQRFLGSSRDVEQWPSRTEAKDEAAIEQQGLEHVLAAVADLRALEGVDAPPDPQRAADAVRDALDATVPSGTTLGRGVLVAHVDQFAGADLDLLLVLGMAEGSLPHRPRQHPVLRDHDRTCLSPALATVASRRVDARCAWEAALRSAPRVVLSFPRADSRSQRRTVPSPWYVEQATRMAGRLVSAAEIERARHVQGQDENQDPPWLSRVPSFVAASREAVVHASVHELDVSMALGGHVDALATADPRLARGLAAARARGAGTVGPWTGTTGPLPPSLREDVDGHLSASSLQQWATCPASHYFQHVLGVRHLEDRAAEDVIDARDKGDLVHDVLEEFFGAHLGTVGQPGRPPEQAWTTADVRAAQALLEQRAAELEVQGLTGRPVLWQAQLARLRRAIARVLAVDSRLRQERRSWPIAVEAAFGRQDVPELVVRLDEQGCVPFAGYIDRIDATADGGLVVLDYKTGAGSGYDAIPERAKPKPGADLVDRGRKLQLLLYALAARQLQQTPQAPVEAWYWFVEKGDLQRGAPVGSEDEQRLRSVLDVVVGGIRAGVYPANPGGETWRSGRSTWDNCRFCAFHRVCPTTRAEQWRQQSQDPRVRSYAALTDPQDQ